MEILEKIEKLRIEKGWSVNYLAMEAGLTQSTLNNLYSRNSEPKISTLKQICRAFNISLAEFFKDEPSSLDEQIFCQIRKLSPSDKEALLQLLSHKNNAH